MGRPKFDRRPRKKRLCRRRHSKGAPPALRVTLRRARGPRAPADTRLLSRPRARSSSRSRRRRPHRRRRPATNVRKMPLLLRAVARRTTAERPARTASEMRLPEHSMRIAYARELAPIKRERVFAGSLSGFASTSTADGAIGGANRELPAARAASPARSSMLSLTTTNHTATARPTAAAPYSSRLRLRPYCL